MKYGMFCQPGSNKNGFGASSLDSQIWLEPKNPQFSPIKFCKFVHLIMVHIWHWYLRNEKRWQKKMGTPTENP